MPGKVKGLLHWCKKVTDGYRGGEVTDMTSSWKNGLAFCALIHRFKPHLIDYGSLLPTDVYNNNKLAYSIAEKEFGIMSLLDPNDMVEMASPDRNSVALYVSQFYEYFKDEPIVEREVEYKYTEMDLMSVKSVVQEETLDNIPKLDNGVNKEQASSNGKIVSFEAKSAEVISKENNMEDAEKRNNSRVETIYNRVEYTEMAKEKKKDSSSDIDDIFETNVALLQEASKLDDNINEECNSNKMDIETNLEKKDFDQCDSVNIPENISGSYKSDAVIKAAVSAGITAVAITASNDSDAEALGDVLGSRNLQEETDKNMQPELQNGKAVIPEIQITVFKEGKTSEDVETPYVEKSVKETNNPSNEQYVTPEIEMKIKSMHEQSIATSSSDSFQSTEYIIVDNEHIEQDLDHLKNISFSGVDKADNLVVVLQDVDSDVETDISPDHPKKKLKSYSSESFTSTSSLASSNSDKIHKHGDTTIGASNLTETFNGNLIVPDKDSETEIFVDEEDEEPPALPTVGPPPLPEQQTGEPYGDDEVVMQGELEVLCPEPENSDVLCLDFATDGKTVSGTLSEQHVDGDGKSSEVLEPLSVSTVDAVPDQTVSIAGTELEPSAEGLAVGEVPITVSHQDSSLENMPPEQLLSVSVILENTERERTATLGTDSDSKKLPSQDKTEIHHSSSSSDSSSDSSSSSEDEGEDHDSKSDAGKKNIDSSIAANSGDLGKAEMKLNVKDNERAPEPCDSAEKEDIESGEPFISKTLEAPESPVFSSMPSVPIYNTEKEDIIPMQALPVMRIKSMSSTESNTDEEKVYIDINKIVDQEKAAKVEDISSCSKHTENAESPDVNSKDVSVNQIAKDLVSEIINGAVLKLSSPVSNPDQSYKVDEKVVSDRVSKLEKSADTKALDNKGTSKRMPFKKDASAAADIDVSVLRKAEDMARKMAEKKSEIQHSPRSPTDKSKKLNEGDKVEASKEKVKYQDKEKSVDKDKEDARTRRMEILRQLQRSTRPTKKRTEDAKLDKSDSSFADTSTDFKKKMTMWVRKSSTAQEPDETVSSSGSSTPDSSSRKRFPSFPSSPVQTPTSPRDDQTNFQKLTQSLPSSPRPGSVAEYVRRISLSAQQKPVVSQPDTDTSDDTVVLRRPKPAVDNQEKVMFRRSTGGISPGFVLSRPSRLSQPIKVSVKPLVQRYSEIEENKEINSQPPAPSPKSSRNSGDFSLVVKPLNERYTLTEEETNTKKKAELERKDSLNKHNPPKRELSINRPRSRSSSRERNVWQHDYESDIITSPAIDTKTSVTRRDSFEVKVRPVSLQLKEDESVSGNKQDLPRRQSLPSAGFTPSKSGSKVNISIQPLSPRFGSDSDSNAPEPNVLPIAEKVISPEKQTLSTTAPDNSTQERQSRPRTSLSPRWTSKIDTRQTVPKMEPLTTEPLTITTKRPGKSVLNYVQSCLNQKTVPKSIQEKASSRRPATFTSVDISKPTVLEKKNLKNTLSGDMPPSLKKPEKTDGERVDQKNVINVVTVDSKPSLKKPSKVDNVSICNSIFGSKAKIILKKEETDLNKNIPAKDIAKHVPRDKNVTGKDSSSSSPSVSSSASSSFVDEHKGLEQLAPITKDIEVEIVDLPKHSVDDEQTQIIGKDSPTSANSITPVSLGPKDTDVIDPQKRLRCKKKSRSDSSSSSSSSDSESENDDGVNEPSLPAKLKEGDTKSITDVAAEEMPEVVTENMSTFNAPEPVQRRDLEEHTPAISTISMDSSDNKMVEKEGISDSKSVDSTSTIDGDEIMPPLVASQDSVTVDAEPPTVPHIEVESVTVSFPEKEMSDNGMLKVDLAAPEVQMPEIQESEILHDTIEKERSDNGVLEIAIAAPETQVPEVQVSEILRDAKMDDSSSPVYISKKSEDSNKSGSESSDSEEKKDDQSLSSNSTSSVSSVEIEKPELKAGLKTIILELEKEIDLQEHKVPDVESSAVDKSPVCESADTGSVEISPVQEHSVIQPILDVPLSFEEENEEISEKDLFEDFDNLVISLQKKEGITEYAKDLDVVVEDEEADKEREPGTSETLSSTAKADVEKSLSSSSNSSISQKDGDAEPSISTVEQEVRDVILGDRDTTVDAPNITDDQMVVEAEIAILPEKVLAVEAEIISSETLEETTITRYTESAVECKVLQSSSSSSASTSSSSSGKEEEDEFLRNVIEDSQPFKAPLLEEIIDNSPQKAGNIEKNKIVAPIEAPTNIQADDEIPVDSEKSLDDKSKDVRNQSPTDRHVPALSIIKLEDPIILSAVADANDVTSPLEVNVSILETSIEGLDRSSPVLFPEEEVLKQHGFTDIVSEIPEDDPVLQSAINDSKAEERKTKLRKDSTSSSSSSDSEDDDKEDRIQPSDILKSNMQDADTDTVKPGETLDKSAQSEKAEGQSAQSIVSERPEGDPALQSAITYANVEERKKKLRKNSSSSSSSSDSEDDGKEDKEEPSGYVKSNMQDADIEIAKPDGIIHTMTEETEMKLPPLAKTDTENVSKISSSDIQQEQTAVQVEDQSEPSEGKVEDQSAQDDKVDDQSVQSESEDGMKYKFQGKDGNCYLLLDSDPTSPVAKTLIAKEKQKSEKLKNSSQSSISDEQIENLKNSSLSSMSDDDIKKLKNSSLSSMSDDQIQNVIDSISMKHSEYIPVSDISVSLKNPEYLLTQAFDPFELEVIEPRHESFIEAEVIYPESKPLDNEPLEESEKRDESDLKLDLHELIKDQEPEKEAEHVEDEENTALHYQESYMGIDNREPPHIVAGQDDNVMTCQPDLVPEGETTFIEHNVIEHPKTISTEESASDTSSTSSSKGSDSKVHKKKKKRRKYKHTKKKHYKSEPVKCDEELSEPKRRKISSSSDTEPENIESNEEKRSVPNERFEPTVVSVEGFPEHAGDSSEGTENVLNDQDIHIDITGEPVDNQNLLSDLTKTVENKDTSNDKTTSENIGPLKKSDKLKSDDSSSTSDSSSGSESSASDTETEKNVIEVVKDNINIDEFKSKVYHSDDNLKSEIKDDNFKSENNDYKSKSENSDRSDSDKEEIIKISKHKELLSLQNVTKHEEIPNYENWPIVKVNVKSEEDKKDTDKANQDNDEKFLIGREKDPSKSEVARLIQQSLEQDRKREEVRRLEQDRYKELQDKLKPRDEVLEHEHIRHLSETSSITSNKEDDHVDLDESSQSGGEGEIEEMGEDVSEDLLGGEATPLSAPSVDEISSPDEQPERSEKAVVEVFDLQESSGDDISPDMESQALFVKLKEAQCKNAVLEAEMAKLKAKIIVLENTEGQKRQYEKRCEEMAARLLEMEKQVSNARKEINHYQDMLEGSQGQYIALEKKLRGEASAIEKKYHKAKKIIKEYQQREKDFLAERESLLQQQTEKDQQYNALVKSLKDRIFKLEKELAEVQRAAGLPVQVPSQSPIHHVEEAVAKTVSPVVQSTPVAIKESGSPVMSPTTDTASVSSESDISQSEPISSEADVDHVDGAVTFESIPKTELLDTSANRGKAQLASAIPSRRPPTKSRSKSQDSIEGSEDPTDDIKRQSGLESWTRHDRTAEYVLNLGAEDTVKKKKAQHLGTDPAHQDQGQRTEAETPPPEYLPPPPPPPAAPASEDGSDHPRDRQGSVSGESSSTVSQTSYDPSKPSFRGMDSEIPASDTVSVDTTGTGETQGSGSSAGAAGTTFTKKSKGIKIPKLPFKFGVGEKDQGGVVLVSNRSLISEDDSGGGVTLLSKKKLDTGSDFDGASTISDVSSSYMVGELDEAGKSSTYNFSGTPASDEHPSQPSRHNQNQFSSGAISQWNNEHVCHWLMGIEMDKYSQIFKEKSITGIQLALLDGNKLKAMGIANAKDRELFKKKIKELKLALDKERKQLERERKQQEKEQKAREREQKKLSKKK